MINVVTIYSFISTILEFSVKMRIGQFWQRTFFILLIVWLVLYVLSTFKHKQRQENIDDRTELVIQKLTKALRELDEVHKKNAELEHHLSILNKKLKICEIKVSKQQKALKGPSGEYEQLRRRIFSNTKEIRYYVNSELRRVQEKQIWQEVRSGKIGKMIDEHFRSLLHDISALAVVDGYAEWRLKEHRYLSALVEKRLRLLQNPRDCRKSKKLVCTLNANNMCDYGCQVHRLVSCMIVAYATRRTMVLDDSDNQYQISCGWQTIFMPLSNTCVSTDGESHIFPWPVHTKFIKLPYHINIKDKENSSFLKNTQVVRLTLPIPIQHPRPPYLPLVLPEDLVERINVLHGDPAVWWIGQFLKYVLRPQLSTNDVFDEYANRFDFRTPIVGVHISRWDKTRPKVAVHNLDEYMHHVEDYYRTRYLNGWSGKKQVYLATDEPNFFKEAKRKYPKYEIIGNPKIESLNRLQKSHDSKLMNFIIDVYFLSHSSHLVCTFSSNICRIVYELLNSDQPDASTHFTSLDDIFYFTGQRRRISIAVLSHVPKGLNEMDLKLNDQIEVVGNNWDGYSKGTNLRTKKNLLYPTFKTIPAIEFLPFASYPNMTISFEGVEDVTNEVEIID